MSSGSLLPGFLRVPLGVFAAFTLAAGPRSHHTRLIGDDPTASVGSGPG
ncbi:hypothetical protein [Methanoregula sp.]